jgi:hypothetical protein
MNLNNRPVGSDTRVVGERIMDPSRVGLRTIRCVGQRARWWAGGRAMLDGRWDGVGQGWSGEASP